MDVTSLSLPTSSLARYQHPLVELFVNCNKLEGGLPDTFASMTALRSLLVNGNKNITGTLPLAWGAAGSSLRLEALSLQDTSLSGPIPASWSTVVNPFGYATLCGTEAGYVRRWWRWRTAVSFVLCR